MRDGNPPRDGDSGAWVDFGQAHEVLLKIGVSFVGEEGARTTWRRRFPGGNSTRSARRQRLRGRNCWTARRLRAVRRISENLSTPGCITRFFRRMFSATRTAGTSGSTGISLSPRLAAEGAIRQLFRLGHLPQHGRVAGAVFPRARVRHGPVACERRRTEWATSRWEAANDVTYVMGGDSPAPVIASSYAFGARTSMGRPP